MSIVEWEKDGSVAVVKMNHGTNVHNLDFANELNKALEEAAADTGVTAIILTSADEKAFSTGVDIAWMGQQMQEKNMQNIKDFMYGMNEVFKKLLLLPVPTIAAINGHAFGNGAILACACDFRMMRADRGYFCFPEVDLGIPFLPGMLAFVKKSIPYYKFNEIYLSGRRLTAPEMEEHHIIEKACADIPDLMKEALAFANTFAKKRGIFAEHKKRLHKEITDIMANEDGEFIDSVNLFVQE